MSTVESGIEALLLAAAGVTALVSTRITAGPIGNPDLARPYITIEHQATDDQHSTDAPASLARNLVSVYCVATTKKEASTIRSAVKTALNGYTGGGARVTVADGDDVDIASIRRSGMQQSAQQLNTRTYRQAIFFSVWSRDV